MNSQLSARLSLICAYFATERNFQLPIGEVGRGIIKPPCTWLGPRLIEAINETFDPRFVQVKIRSIRTQLCWPRSLPLFDLYKVVTECFHESDWHFYEVPETRVEPGQIALDCGAAEGIFSLRVMERAEQVVAFEPLPLFVESMRTTFTQSRKVSVVHCALGEVEGQAYLEGGSLYGVLTKRPTGIPVRVTTIDQWAQTAGLRVDFIKGDLEGSELSVLKGARNTIARDRPKIAVTVYHPGNDWQSILAYLRRLVPSYQYRVKGLSYNAGRARPVMLHCWPG